MISSLIIAASLSASGVSVSLLPLDSLQVGEGAIRLGQVVDLSNYDKHSRRRLSQIIIADLPHSDQPVRISTHSIARWASAAVPEFQFSKTPERDFLVQTVQKPDAGKVTITHQSICYTSIVPILADEIISRKNTHPSDCQGKPESRIAYFDRKNRLPRAAGDLSANTYLGRIALPNLAIADRGITMAFVTRDGPVQVIRRVEALQPARSGRPLFVSSSDGKVFKTIYRAEETE